MCILAAVRNLASSTFGGVLVLGEKEGVQLPDSLVDEAV